jgi:hypothetical protein
MIASEARYADILTSYIPRGWSDRRAYWRQAREADIRRRREIARFHNCCRGRRAFILGNAPSIKETDLRPLKSEVTIAVNSTFRLYEQMGYQANYTVVTDRIRWHELRNELLPASTKSQVFYCDDREVPSPWQMLTPEEQGKVILLNQSYLLPPWLAFLSPIRNRSGFYFYRVLRGRGFSWDIAAGVTLGVSSIFTATQLAAYMGCSSIVLLGVDMDYSGPQAHFHGKPLHTPGLDYDRDAKPLFIQFRNALASRQIEFLNAAPGGKVDDLKRVDYRSLLPSAPVKVA